jgi:hypothetical protein
MVSKRASMWLRNPDNWLKIPDNWLNITENGARGAVKAPIWLNMSDN